MTFLLLAALAAKWLLIAALATIGLAAVCIVAAAFLGGLCDARLERDFAERRARGEYDR